MMAKIKGLTGTITYGLHGHFADMELDEWQQKAHPWTVELRYKGRQMTLPYFTGPAIDREPTPEEVLECLLSDAWAADGTFEDFCANCGYDEDSRKAERIYYECKRIDKGLDQLLREDRQEVYELIQDQEMEW